MKMIIYCDDPAGKPHYCAVHGFHNKHGTDNCPSLLKLVEEIEQGLHCNSRGKVDFGPPVHGTKPTIDKKHKRDGFRITGADEKSKKLKKDQETRINAILAEQSSSSSDNDVKVDELLTKFRQMDIKVNRQTVNKPSVKLDLRHALNDDNSQWCENTNMHRHWSWRQRCGTRLY